MGKKQWLIMGLGIFILIGSIKWYDHNHHVDIDYQIKGAIISSQSAVSYVPSLLEMKGTVTFRLQPIYLGTFSLKKDPDSRFARHYDLEDYHYDHVQMMLAKEDQQAETFLGIVNHTLSSKAYFDKHHDFPKEGHRLQVYYQNVTMNPIYIKLENGDYFVGPCDNAQEGKALAQQLMEGSYESYMMDMNH